MNWLKCNICGHLEEEAEYPYQRHSQCLMLEHFKKCHDWPDNTSVEDDDWFNEVSIKSDDDLFHDMLDDLDQVGLMHSKAMDDEVIELFAQEAAAVNDEGTKRQLEEMCRFHGMEKAHDAVRAIIDRCVQKGKQ